MSEAVDQEIRELQSVRGSQRDPDGLAFASLADAHLRAGQIREALALLTEGTARYPDYATGHAVATRLYHEQGMSAEAEISARRVLALDPRNVVALSALSDMLQEQGRDDDAAELRWTLVDTDPGSEEARAIADLPAVRPEDIPIVVPVTDVALAVASDPDVAEPAVVDDGLIDLSSISLPEEPSVGPISAMAPFETEDDSALAGDLDLDSLLIEPGASLAEPELLLADAEDDGVPAADGSDEDLSDLLPEAEVEFADLGAVGSGEPADVMDLGALAPDESADLMDLEALAPDEPVDVMDLGALAPDEPADVMDLGALAPDEPVDVMDLGALAPDEPADVMDLGALAPDEPVDVMDLGALAPDEPADVMELVALAPDDPAEVMELVALAPDEPADVMELVALAPDDPAEVMELVALAPDEPDEVMELVTLAPDEPVDVTDLEALAPDEPADVTDLEALAPDEPDDATGLEALAPDLPSLGGGDTAPPAPPETKKMIGEEPIHTRTLAALYVQQGFTDRALGVYRSLLDSEPGSEDLIQKIAELEGGAAPSPSPATDDAQSTHTEDRAASLDASPALESLPSTEEEVEELARDLAEAGSEASDDLDTPFAWTAEEESTEADRGDIGRYFDSLLDWKRGD